MRYPYTLDLTLTPHPYIITLTLTHHRYHLDDRRPAAEAAAAAILHAQHAVWASGRKPTQGGEAVRAVSAGWRGVCTVSNSALHCVAMHDRADTYTQLLSLGAKPFVRNGWGQSPLALAAAHGSFATFCAALDAISEKVIT